MCDMENEEERRRKLMTSYQRLKCKCNELKCENYELQKTVDMFKNALTIQQAQPESLYNCNDDGTINGIINGIVQNISITTNKIYDEMYRIKLQNWVASNLDKNTIKYLLELKDKQEA